MPRRRSPKNKTSELASLNPEPKKKRRSKGSAGPAGISVLSADIAPPPARKPRTRVRKTPRTAVAAGHSESLTIMADPPAMSSKHPAIHESVPAAPVLPVDPPSADLSPSDKCEPVGTPAAPATFSDHLSAGMMIAIRWYRASLTWMEPHIDRLRKIDLRPLSAALLRAMSIAARTTIRSLHWLSVRLLSGGRNLSRINPRVAVALVSFAAFGALLTRVSPESEARKIPHIAAVASVNAAIPQVLPAKQQSESSKRAPAVAARMIDAPSRVSSSCEKQAWPYVTASCLTMVTDPASQKIPAPGPANDVPKPGAPPKPEARVLPASTSNAQAMISPVMPSSMDDDRPSRREIAKRRHHEGRHARGERKRIAPQAQGVSQAMAFTPLKSSNTPW